MPSSLFPDNWLEASEPEVELPYVGMGREQALSAAEAAGIVDLRLFEIPLPENTAFTADLRPSRLNLMIVEGRVARAAIF